MTRQIVLRPSITNRRQPLLANDSPGGSLRSAGNLSPRGSMSFANQSSRRSRRFAEVAGGTTAECAAVCCCCPCGIMKFLVLTVYKVPAGLCRKALKHKRIKRLKKKKKGMLTGERRKGKCGCVETEIQIHPVCVDDDDDDDQELWVEDDDDDKSECLTSKEIQEMEREMWDRFYSTGFWRSPSQRDS